MPKDVAGVSRPGLFESIPLDEQGTTATVQRGNAARATFKAQGPKATSEPTFRARNERFGLRYAAEEQGAVEPEYALTWPVAARTVRRGR